MLVAASFPVLRTNTEVGLAFVSRDGGQTWENKTALAGGRFSGSTVSGDGRRVLLMNYGSYLYVSLDGGVHFAPLTVAGKSGWYSAASDETGLKPIISLVDGYIISSNGALSSWTGVASAFFGVETPFPFVMSAPETVSAMAGGPYDSCKYIALHVHAMAAICRF